MTTGFVQRFKGKIAVVLGGISQNGVESSASLHYSGTPTNGTSGTYAGIAGVGILLLDTTNGVLYQNKGTLASPTWAALTTATGAGTYTGNFDGIIGATTPAAATVTTLSATSVTTTGINTESVANALTASTTQTRVGGLALTNRINRLTTVANAGDAVTLPALAAGQRVIVINAGAHAASVFPNGSSDAIDGGTAGAAVTLTNPNRAEFICIAANTIISAQLGSASA